MPAPPLLDADGTEIAALVDAVVRPYPSRVGGDPVSWRYDDATRELELTWRSDPAIRAPTVINAPAPVYPTGVTVECVGPAPGETTTAVVRPAV